jgi:hypothetical protein
MGKGKEVKKTDKVLAREMTGWEVMQRIKDGNDIAIVPVGCMEMHSPQQPLGTDTFIAEAVAHLVARKVTGTVFDTIAYAWPMSTEHSFPTIGISAEMEKKCVRVVCDQLSRVGFKRIYVLQWHGPGLPLQILAQEFFEQTGVPLAVFRLMRLFFNNLYQETKDWGQRGIASEPTMCAAACRVLNANPTIDPLAGKHLKVPAHIGHEALKRIIKTGADLGSLGNHDCQHGSFEGRVDIELGTTFLHKLADLIASTADDMAEYRDAWKGVCLKDSYPSAIMGNPRSKGRKR